MSSTALLYEKIKIQQQTLARGELAYREESENMRVLRLKLNSLRRELHIQRASSSNLEALKEEVYTLQHELLEVRARGRVCVNPRARTALDKHARAGARAPARRARRAPTWTRPEVAHTCAAPTPGPMLAWACAKRAHVPVHSGEQTRALARTSAYKRTHPAVGALTWKEHAALSVYNRSPM
eukprot:5296959-Pleurochrysis_carterae.AAC.4